MQIRSCWCVLALVGPRGDIYYCNSERLCEVKTGNLCLSVRCWGMITGSLHSPSAAGKRMLEDSCPVSRFLAPTKQEIPRNHRHPDARD